MLGAIKHNAAEIILFFRKTVYYCTVHANSPTTAAKEVSISLLLSYGPNSPVLNSNYYKTARFILQLKHKLSQQD